MIIHAHQLQTWARPVVESIAPVTYFPVAITTAIYRNPMCMKGFFHALAGEISGSVNNNINYFGSDYAGLGS